ncbi:DUF2974 domain-containing protein [Anaerofilum sp. BX8]|uniref:DUF2974 domain-containing protein n=1 Tax=Anaerofilum hominis TaxID=2763016 RepID=A0A923I4C8_9FIRM|nr:DUF2974 domain-containing protein [Anaerofilum hominis]MBC5580105.1 DUF2974 domain-containing protein [Anaerofilum hominis]
MANILDYLEWRGDLTLQQAPFNPVDGLILCRLAYVPFDGIAPGPGEGTATIGGAARVLLAQQTPERRAVVSGLWKGDAELLAALMDSGRFSGMLLESYVSELDPEEEKQFSAFTVCLGDGSRYVAYRGTDSTLVGWKEDFNMAFTTPVPAQRTAAEYLRARAAEKPGPLRVGGHSKGGNLAVFAAAFCGEETQGRILEVQNNDGPGFEAAVTAQPGYRRIAPRVRTMVPQSSVVGMLLEHEEAYTVVHSTQLGLMQHDLYSWQVRRTGFVCLESVDEGSRMVDRALKEWISSMTPAQRETFVDVLFGLLDASGAQTVGQLSLGWLKNAGALARTLKGIDEPTREAMSSILKALSHAARHSLAQAFPRGEERRQNDVPAQQDTGFQG